MALVKGRRAERGREAGGIWDIGGTADLKLHHFLGPGLYQEGAQEILSSAFFCEYALLCTFNIEVSLDVKYVESTACPRVREGNLISPHRISVGVKMQLDVTKVGRSHAARASTALATTLLEGIHHCPIPWITDLRQPGQSGKQCSPRLPITLQFPNYATVCQLSYSSSIMVTLARSFFGRKALQKVLEMVPQFLTKSLTFNNRKTKIRG